MNKLILKTLTFILFFSCQYLSAQSSKNKTENKIPVSSVLNGFKFRSVGPAFMSGRIADIAIDPSNENVWYVAVGSGGVWKTENSGTTWNPLTDNMTF